MIFPKHETMKTIKRSLIYYTSNSNHFVGDGIQFYKIWFFTKFHILKNKNVLAEGMSETNKLFPATIVPFV